MNKKLIEIQKLMDKTLIIDTNEVIKEIKIKYKKELERFIYIDNKDEIYIFKNKYIKYVGKNGLLYYGGIFYKTEYKNTKLYIYLINQNKKPWIIDFDDYYIFYSDRIRNNNDYTRNIFDIFINENKIN